METFVPLRTLLEPDDFSVPPDNPDIPADYQEYRSLLAGLILDISLQHHADSKRYLDIIKIELVKAIVPLEESDNRIYIYHPDNIDIPAHLGETISKLMDYIPPPVFNDADAVAYTLSLIGHEDRGLRKKLIFITDRNRGRSREIMQLTMSRNKDCELYFIGIGDKYNPDLLGLPMTTCHLGEPYGLAEKMTEVFLGGSNSCPL